MTERTRFINQRRGFLMERWISVGTGRHVFQKQLLRLMKDGTQNLSNRMSIIVSDMAMELATINNRVRPRASPDN